MARSDTIVGSPNNSNFEFGERSLSMLVDVHPDLVKLVKLALKLSYLDFGIHCGKRTMTEQRKLVKQGASTTLNSRHVPQPIRGGGNGFAHAVDIHPYIGGEVRWDMPYFAQIEGAFHHASLRTFIPYEWGGHWKTFPDGPHFQLPFGKYPTDKKYELPIELEPLVEPEKENA